MPTETLCAPGPTPSCRVDYLTNSFKLPTAQHCEDLINLCWAIGHRVLPNGDMQPPMPSRLFQERRLHDSGCSVELTPPSSDRRNAGTGILTIPGAVCAALDSSERSALYREIYLWEGHYRCTRIDTQLTVLNPVQTIEEFVDEAQAGNIWAKGYSTGQPWMQVDRAGNHRVAPTWYFGTPDSPTRARIYDHGAKQGWEIPTMRFETQQRKRNADDTFRFLVNQLNKEVDTEPLFLVTEANVVKSVSREKLDLRDTTDIDREALGGKWLRKAPRLGWYAELVDAPGAPVERRARPVPTLEQSMSAMADQYGGNVGAWILQTMATEGCTLKQASEALVMRCIGRMADQHRVKAKISLSAAEQAVVDKLYAKLTPEASKMAEHSWCE